MAYTPSDKVKKLEENYYAHLQNKPSEFSSDYTAKADEALNNYINRGDFKYNPATDTGYQAARKQYTTGGKQAMKDTLGTATELTGGYDNSYAQAAAQQTYNQYMSELANLMPQHEQQAYSRWQNQGQQMLDYYTLFNAKANEDYSKHRDAMTDYNNETTALYNAYNNAYTNEYNNYWADVNQANLDRTYDRSVYESDRKYERDAYEFDKTLESKTTTTTTPALYRQAYEGAAGTENEGLMFYYNSDGKLEKYEKGVNPYTGSVNPDAKGKDGEVDPDKVFSNGYQPNNIGGVRLEDSGLQEINLYGRYQKIWQLKGKNDGHYYYWDGANNRYVDITDMLEIV